MYKSSRVQRKRVLSPVEEEAEENPDNVEEVVGVPEGGDRDVGGDSHASVPGDFVEAGPSMGNVAAGVRGTGNAGYVGMTELRDLIKEIQKPPVMMGALPNIFVNFNGESDDIVAEEWLSQLNSSSILHNWPENYKLEIARLHLIGAARDWYSARRHQLTTWVQFELQFKRTFVKSMTLTEKLVKLQNRVQGVTESLEAYMHAKYILCQALHLPLVECRMQRTYSDRVVQCRKYGRSIG